MKEFAKREQRQLYVVSTPLSVDEGFDFSRNSLDRSFQGWLGSLTTEELKMSARAVVTTISNDFVRSGIVQKHSLQLCPPASGLAAEPASERRLFPTKLTTEDYVQVMLATIREGVNHSRWPREVVEHFLAAEVIADSEQ